MPIQPHFCPRIRRVKRWGFPPFPSHGHKSIGGRESEPLRSVRQRLLGCGGDRRETEIALSLVGGLRVLLLQNRRAGAGFPYNEAHWGYCEAILANPKTYPKLKLMDPASCVLSPGDLLWAARGGRTARRRDFLRRRDRALKKGRWFCSHADIVVEVRSGEVDVIGATSRSVNRSTYKTMGDKIRDQGCVAGRGQERSDAKRLATAASGDEALARTPNEGRRRRGLGSVAFRSTPERQAGNRG